MFNEEDYSNFFDYDAIAAKMKERLKLHHSLYDSRCKDTLLEESFHKALLSLNIPNIWKPGSHTVKYDIMTNGPDIGIKSGQIDFVKNIIKYSGSRLGSYEDIKEKCDFLESNKPYFTFFMTEQKKNKNYFFCVLENSKITYNLEWEEKEKIYETLGKGYYLKIEKKMSDQLWTEIDINKLTHIQEIVI